MRIAYLSLQAVQDGQDTWAAVMEIVRGFEAEGEEVDCYFVNYEQTQPPSPITRVTEMLRVQRRLIKRLAEYDALYVRAHPLAFLVARAAVRRGVPIVQECNGPYDDLFIAWPSLRLARPVFERLQRTQYRSAAAIVSVAEGLTKWLIKDTGNHNVITNGNGANIEVFTPDAPRRTGLPDRFAVFFGQFPAWQGIGTLLDAVTLPQWPAGLPVVFVGDGAMRPAVEEAAAAHPERVQYVGRLPYAEVGQAVAHATLSFVPMMAPERETKFSPLKLYESMACGVPVVASDVIGISEVVRASDCGLLVPAGDAEAFARAAAEIAGDAERASGMGDRARQAVVEHYSWRARARQRLQIVREVVTSA